MAIQNMLAKSSSGVSEIERRVLKAIPEWMKWTRQLKQVYVLLPVFGSSDQGIEEMCDEFGWKVAQGVVHSCSCASTTAFKLQIQALPSAENLF